MTRPQTRHKQPDPPGRNRHVGAHREHGFSLLELALSLAILTLLMGSLIPLQRTWALTTRQQQQRQQMEQWLSHIEGFAVTHMRLPCPAADADGVESAQLITGPCTQQHGLLPWRTLSLPIPNERTLYAVASLDTLGKPYAHALTRQAGVLDTPIDSLSAAIFAPPETGAHNSTALPALRVCEASADGAALWPSACPSGRYLSVSAVALLSADAASSASFSAQTRNIFIPSDPQRAHLLRWISYERLIWLYLRAGVFTQP